MPAISVLIPAYNVQRYVERALASIQAQSVADIQIVVVDDCSTDGTLDILNRISVVDRRIDVVRTPNNSGIVTALNLGLPLCHAPFIARMDADDIAMQSRLEKQLQFLNANPEIALVGTATMAIDENGHPVGLSSISSVPRTEREIERTLLLAPPCLHIWLARREVYEKLGGYRQLAPAEDYDFLLRAVSAGFRLGNVNEPLMQIRIRSGNTLHLAALKQRKTHSYVIGLHRKRLAVGTDDFTPDAFEKAVHSRRLETAAHRCATQLVRRAFRTSSRLTRFSLLLLSAVVSPWQARYFCDRLRVRLKLQLT